MGFHAITLCRLRLTVSYLLPISSQIDPSIQVNLASPQPVYLLAGLSMILVQQP